MANDSEDQWKIKIYDHPTAKARIAELNFKRISCGASRSDEQLREEITRDVEYWLANYARKK